MKTVIGDFHVHTLLSPCAEIEMTPHHIVMQAAEYGIQLLAVTDHNASANAVAAIQAGERYGIKVFPGMEVECREEAHIVVLFDNLKQLRRWQKIVDFSMRGLKNIPERFGAQFVVDDDDNFVAEDGRQRVIQELKELKVSDPVSVTINATTYKRDNKTISQLKYLRGYRCQMCKIQIPKADGGFYIEGAHIDPKKNRGNELPNNILILCPNHHKEFDYGKPEIISRDDEHFKFKLNGEVYDISLKLE